MFGDYRPISITLDLSKGFKKIVAGKLSNFLKSNSMLHTSQFLYRMSLGTCDALLTLSHDRQFALDRGIEGRLVQLDFSAAFDRVRYCGLLCKLRSLSIEEQFLSIALEFLSGKRQRVRLDEKISASGDVVSRVPQRSVLGPFLFVLHTSELFHMVGNYILGYADDTSI